jgi:hypothetical protein
MNRGDIAVAITGLVIAAWLIIDTLKGILA